MNDQFFSLTENAKTRAGRIRKTAKERLGREGVRMTLCVGVLICIFVYILGLLATDMLASMFLADYYNSEDVFVSGMMQTIPFLFAVLFAVPFFEGYRRMTASIADGKDPDLRLLFSAFSSFRSFFGAYFIAFCAIVRPVVAVGFVAGSCGIVAWMFHTFLDMEPGALIMMGTVVLTSAAAAGWLYLTRFGGVRAYVISVRSASIGTSFRITKRVKKKQGVLSGTIRLYAGYIPLILLSFLTLGVLFFIHTIPLISLAAAYNSEDLISEKY